MFNLNLSDFFVLLSLSFLCFLYYSSKNTLLKSIIVVLFILLSSFIVGTRPLNAGFDTHHYIDGFNLLSNVDYFWNVSYAIKTELGIGNDFAFWFIAFVINKLGFSGSDFLYINACISIALLYLGLNKVSSKSAIIILFAFVVCGTFYNTYGNAIRQSYALSLIPFLIYYRYISLSLKKYFFVLFLVFLFHKASAVILFVFFIFTLFSFRTNLIFYFSSLPICYLVKFFISKVNGFSIYTDSSSVLLNPPFIMLNFTLVLILTFRIVKPLQCKIKEGLGYALFIPFLILTSFSTIFSFNEFAYNRVANFAYLLQVLLISFVLLSFFKQKQFMAFIMICLSFLWGVIILNSTSVSIILYG